MCDPDPDPGNAASASFPPAAKIFIPIPLLTLRELFRSKPQGLSTRGRRSPTPKPGDPPRPSRSSIDRQAQ